MELKALMQKLEIINNKQYLTESEEKEQTDKKSCPPMSHVKKMCQDGKSVSEICKMHPDCDHTELKQMVADCKETMSKDKKKTDESIVFTSSIARGLVEEFGYDLDERVTPDGKGGFTGGLGTPTAAAPAASGTPNPYQGADAAKFASLSPEDQAWLTKGGGKPDINDQYILMRAPNKGKAVATAPGAGGAATKPTAPAVAPGGVQAQGDDDGNTMITKPDGTVQLVGPDGKSLANGGRADAGAATKPTTGTPPAGGAGGDAAVAATREKFKALMDKLEKTGGVSGSAPAPSANAVPPLTKKPATGAATKPAAPSGSTMPAVDIMGNPTGIQEDPNEGNEFSGELAKAKASGADEFEVDGNKYPVKETVTYNDDQTLLAIRNIRY